MEPPTDQLPRGTKRPLGGGDVDKASGARRYDDGCDAADFLKDDDEEGGGGDDDTGFLDESGTFVEHAGREGTKEDAWLGTPDADTASAATKRARKALQRQEEDERLVHDLVSARTVFEIKKRLAGLLEPGETVPRALRRLKGLGAYAAGGARRTAGKMDEAARRAFDEITDAAAELFDRGDLDAYSDDREEFESAAWVYEYGRRDRVSASAAREAGEEHEADRAASAADMFREDAGASGEDLREASGAAAEKGTGGDGSDYVYDPASGYYYSSSSGYFYDAASGCYCSASTGTWFSYNHHHNDGQVLRHNRRDVASDHLRSEHR